MEEKYSWHCHTCNCVFDVVFDKSENETNMSHKHDIKCMFCNVDLGNICNFSNNIIYRKKPEKHNALWTFVEEMVLLKNVIENKNYNYMCNILKRTHDSIHRKKQNLLIFIKKNIDVNDISDVKKKFLDQLSLYYDIDETIQIFNVDCSENKYKKFTPEEQNELKKFIEIIGQIRSNYFKSKLKKKKSIKWLNNLMKINKINIIHEQNEGEYNIPNTLYKADGYCKETNTIYEFHGCMYHGCIVCFNKNDKNKKIEKENEILYKNTLEREEKIKKLGYKLVTIWEHEFKN